MRRAIPFLIFIWTSGAVHAAVPVVTPNIDTHVASGTSPLAVSFDATRTSHSDSTINTNRFHQLLYQWDYDDPTSGTWGPTGNSRNQMSGPLGAHVFEPSSFPDCGGACKEYTVRLTVSDGLGNSASAAKLITVYNPDDPTNGWGAAGKSICISTVGDFSGCPGVAVRETNAGTFDSILMSKIGGGYRRILFHAGETWNMTASYTLSADGPGLIGAYGNGAFIINFNVGGSSPVRMRGDDWRMQDIHFGGGASKAIFLGDLQVKNWLLQRTTSEPRSFYEMIQTPINYLPDGPDESIHRNLFFIDNHWQMLGFGIDSGYQFFGAVWGISFLGNEFEEAPGTHNIRIQTGEAVLISNNKLGPQQFARNVLNLRDLPNACGGTCPGKPFCGRKTKFYLIQENDFLCTSYTCIGATMQTCADGKDPISPLASQDFIFERNFFKEAPGANMEGSAINLGSDGATTRFVIRNNIIDSTGWNWTTSILGNPGTRIYNNTCYRSDAIADGKAICIYPRGSEECYNNVLYAPNWTGSVLKWRHPDSAGAGYCVNESNNLDNSIVGGITENPFVVNSPVTAADFTPNNSSPLINSGKAIPGLFVDHLANCRTGTPDIGAIERGALPCEGLVPGQPPVAPILLP